MMSTNEIIKALYCCSEPAGKCCCEECPLHLREDSCTTALIKKALELTNRQKAQIEGLQDEVVTKTDMLNKQKSEIERYLHSIKLLEKDVQTAKAENEKNERIIELDNKLIKTQSAEIERLKNSFDAQASLIEKKSLAYDRTCVKHRNEINTAKSEAIKEFAERLKKRFLNVVVCGNQNINRKIDNLVKEMVGDDNG